MVATGLSESPQAYRLKLLEQSDSQIDTWVTGSLRDMAKRKGIVATIHEFSHATRLDEDGLAGVYTLGGGPAATMGRDAAGRLLLPAVSLWCLVPGLRAADRSGGRERLVDFLVATFDEVVYI